MMLQVVWDKCTVTNPDTGEDVILSRGDVVPDYVDDFMQFTLRQIGAVAALSDRDPVAAELAAALTPTPVRLAEHPPLGTQMALAERGTLAGDASARQVASGEQVSAQRPARSASKAEWVEYAVSQGATREDAEKATRDELATLYTS